MASKSFLIFISGFKEQITNTAQIIIGQNLAETHNCPMEECKKKTNKLSQKCFSICLEDLFEACSCLIRYHVRH